MKKIEVESIECPLCGESFKKRVKRTYHLKKVHEMNRTDVQKVNQSDKCLITRLERKLRDIRMKKIRENVDENGLDGYQQSALKAAQTMRNDVNDSGRNKHERIRDEKRIKGTYAKAGKKTAATKLADIDENGLNGFQRAARLGAQTMLNDVDESGLNTFQRSAFKAAETKYNSVDKDGKNIWDKIQEKRLKTLSIEDENGETGFQRSGRKISISLNEIGKNGKTVAQNRAILAAETMKNDIDENGLNCHQRIGKKAAQTLKNDIDENGLNGYQRMNRDPIIIAKRKIAQRQTMESQGKWISLDQMDAWQRFVYDVDKITGTNKAALFECWDGTDYYAKDDIRENFDHDHMSPEYPTVDHKISKIHGFKNGYTPEEIGSLENLCVTRRSINSSKAGKTEEEFQLKSG